MSEPTDRYPVLGLPPCPFCTLPLERIVGENDSAWIVRDLYPLSPGHTLVVPKRHAGSFFELVARERADALCLLDRAKSGIDHEFQPQGYNIGVNDGFVAGQTVPHVHVHLIPRYKGDVADPRGGVRWIFPDKARYWV